MIPAGLRIMDYGALTGVGVAVHAIRDGFLLMHVGIGCKRKVNDPLLSHDRSVMAGNRAGWTEVDDSDLIEGASRRLGPYLRSCFERVRPAYIVVSSASFLRLTGEDVTGVVREASAGLPCDIDLVDVPGDSGDMYTGYARVLEAVCRRVPWTAARDDGSAAIVGYWFDRYEGDQYGNLLQLTRLLGGLGIELRCALLSGDTHDSRNRAADAGLLIELPYARPSAISAVLGGRETLNTELPIGIAGTASWLRRVGRAVGVAPAKVHAFIDARTRRALEPLAPFREQWRGRRVAVFAETPLAAGLCGLVMELGMVPVLVGLRGTSLGGAEAFASVLSSWDLGLGGEARVLENPELAQVRNQVRDLARDRGLDLVIGSSVELNLLGTIPDREYAVRSVEEEGGPRLVEIGFPSAYYHAVQQAPTLGFGGVVAMAQRVLDAPRLTAFSGFRSWADAP